MKKIFSLFLHLLLMLSMLFGSASCERMIFETEGDCPPENIEPEPQPGYIRISVRTEADKAGLSRVFAEADKANAAETEGDRYVSIVVKENEAYTLTATANEGYEFVGWHDDTHDSYLPAGEALVANQKSGVSTQYTAIFSEIEAEPEPGYIRISVRTNLDKAGLSQVYEKADAANAAETEGVRFVSIVVKENEAYTLDATANEGYEFVGWYDETNENYLPVGEPTFEKQSAVSTKYTAIFAEKEVVEPEPEPGYIRISVRTNLDKAGLSQVYEVADETNAAETEGVRFVSIVVKENEAYTLSAAENEGYVFIGWYDDTNDNYLPAGAEQTLKSTVSTRYIALFELEPIVEPEPEPAYYVEFVYDMNMKFADAFPSLVKSVDLYVFDTDGKVVKNYKDSGAALSKKGYRLELTDLASGTYQFLAWCGLEGNTHFSLPAGIETIEDAKLTMARQTDGAVFFSNANLNAVYHGLTSDTLPEAGEYVVTLFLTKDTNNINLSLTQLGNAGMERGQYIVSMTDENGFLDHENAPLSDEPIEYRPWYEPVYGSAQMGSDATDAVNYMRAELSTSRLMENHDTRLVIADSKTGEIVFSIPFMEYVKAFRSENYATMDDQEYLDREDEYNLMLYLENNKEGWIAARIEINGWRVSDNGEVDL